MVRNSINHKFNLIIIKYYFKSSFFVENKMSRALILSVVVASTSLLEKVYAIVPKVHQQRLSVESNSSKVFSRNVEAISNGIVSIEIDLTKGCALTSFVDVSNGINMINTADLGREVQPSFYSGPDNYNGCVWSGQEWPW
jgi:hypothetical protein